MAMSGDVQAGFVPHLEIRLRRVHTLLHWSASSEFPSLPNDRGQVSGVCRIETGNARATAKSKPSPAGAKSMQTL